MDAFLKEASEFDKQSVHSKNGGRSEDAHQAGQDPAANDSAAVKIPAPVVAKKKHVMEPLGVFNNPDGKPQVIHDDPYLAPFIDDLYLRQKEYKKYLIYLQKM